MIQEKHKAQWEKDCLHWRGKILTGEFSHWCDEWDGLPVDETCREWPTCLCFKPTEKVEYLKSKGSILTCGECGRWLTTEEYWKHLPCLE